MSAKVCILVRVSTRGQAKSGLSIAHQLDACETFCSTNGLEVVETFIEVGSGGLSLDERPTLKAALERCKSEGARIVVNKLSRLSRKVSFIATLCDQNTRFYITEMGFRDVSTFEINLFSAFAQMERERISQRTKEGLAKSTKRLGNPRPQASLRRGKETIQRKKEEFNRKMIPIINEIRDTGVKSARGVSLCLNRRGLKGRRGGRFTSDSVIRILKSVEV
jgi:DNA invertase Pin-like site-specific DNA recombinase